MPAATSASAPPRAQEPPGTPVGTFDVDQVAEASGLTVSGRDAGLVWVIDDGPGTTELVAVRIDGRAGPAGTVEVEALDGRDTESLAAGPCAAGSDEPCLFIGDVGDNARSRDTVTVIRLAEPDLSSGLPGDPVAGERLELQYPDARHDAEAILAVDGRVLVVTKAPFDSRSSTTGTTRLYEAPSASGAATGGTLVDHGEVDVPAPTAPLLSGVVGGGVTGAEAVPGVVVLRTYDHALRFEAPSPGADVADFADWPVREIRSVGPVQTEAIAIAADGCRTFVVGEGSGVVTQTDCEDPAPPAG